MDDLRFGKSLKTLLNELKDEFRQWCGMLSIDEIVSNKNLIIKIERFERMILTAIEKANVI